MRSLAAPPLLIALVLMLAGCGGEGGGNTAAPTAEPVWHADAPAQPQTGRHGGFVVRELVTGLVHPWGLAFLPDGGLLVTERPGRLRRIGADGTVSAPLAGVPAVFTQGQSGLLDVALSPQFAQDGLVYLAYGEANWRGNKAGTAVARGRLGADGLDDVEVVFRQEPKLSSGTHIGARLLFDRDGFLFVTAGDSRSAASAQLLDHLQGKLVRIAADGSVPADNPFLGRDGARPEIWSYGHRNAQGLALHPDSGQVWLHEHGPRGGDEINLPQAGRNYGWPVITHGIDYSGEPVPGSTGTQAAGMEQPLHFWPVSPGVSGMAFYSGAAFPQWQGDLFIGALATRELIRLELDGERVVGDERLLADRGERIRDVRQGPDGLLYLLTDDANGKLLQVAPR
jgi:glucose/arabinose dehydrogenase